MTAPAPAPAPRGTHAIILAGGTGSRMPPLPSPATPKALLPVANVPLLHHALQQVHLAGVPSATIVADPAHVPALSALLDSLAASGAPLPAHTLHARAPELAGTADVLRELPLPPAASDALVLAVDALADAPLAPLLAAHRASAAAATLALHAPAPAPAPAPKKGPKKGAKPSAKAKPPAPSLYALLTPDHRALALHTPADLSRGHLRVRAPLLGRHGSLCLRSDLTDPHVYVLHLPFVLPLLARLPAASSLAYDVLPYLARRGPTLARRARAAGWPLPADDVVVRAHLLPRDAYVVRANTVPAYLQANLDAAAGRLDGLLRPDKPAVPLKSEKGKKKPKPAPGAATSPFATAGDKCSVTPDSAVGEKVTAGDRVSVKKSVVGPRATLGDAVKLNGCVLMSNVEVGDGANLAACVVCDGASIGPACTLKECRVAAGVHVPEGTEETGRDFLPPIEGGDGDDDAFEFF